MRCGIILAAALIAMPFAAMSATGAQAQEYCGFIPHLGAVVQCGYSNRESCENTIGKGAMCFINPYVVLNERRATPASRHPEVA
jgi:Protein of unknown function (DUF3551)